MKAYTNIKLNQEQLDAIQLIIDDVDDYIEAYNSPEYKTVTKGFWLFKWKTKQPIIPDNEPEGVFIWHFQGDNSACRSGWVKKLSKLYYSFLASEDNECLLDQEAITLLINCDIIDIDTQPKQ